MALANLKPPMHKNRTTTMGRISGFYQTGSFFRNINLSSKMYDDSRGYSGQLLHFPILGPHGTWMKFTYPEIKAGPWLEARVGQQFGPTWSTHWFHIKFDVPAEWAGREVHFRWNSGSEAMLHDPEFNILQGFGTQDRGEYIISRSWDPAQGQLEYYVEMACSDMFGAGGDMIHPPDNNRFYTLHNADIAVFNRDNFNLTVDFDQINGMAQELSNTHIGYQAMFVANEMVNLLHVDKKAEAQALSAEFFAQGNGEKAHTLYAMGHCHIDTAWLWPYDETVRKCARSFSSQLGLMDEYPNEYTFVCSSAQQYVYVKEHYPALYERIKAKVATGQFMPVGGTWIEMDGNIPNGEAFMRQYYYGQKFFEKEFNGLLCKEFWLPDTFGYSAQIPQMLKHVGIERFLTQKMSWSLVNKFPSHNFWWEGIDGTQVMVHFPPGDSYNMNGLVHEFLNSQNNSLDKGRANCGVYLYGYGDGGGGPTRRMIERIKRVQDVDGLPKVKFSDSNEFFDELAKESHKFYKWVGELYLELHNGTYTSQARIKWWNRKCEFMFREVELLMAMAYATGKATDGMINVDIETIDACWKDFLLNQFHDVLPGSCIEFVAEDAWKIYEDLFAKLMTLRTTYHGRIVGSGGFRSVYNCLPWEVNSVIFFKPDAGQPPSGPNIQIVQLQTEPFENENEGMYRVPANFSAALVSLQPSGYTEFVAQTPANPVTFTPGTAPNFGTFTNGIITLNVTINGEGRPVESLFFAGEEPVFNDFLNKDIEPGMFYIYDDIPMYWDAWDVMDYHLETRRLPNFSNIIPAERFTTGNIVGGYKWGATFGNGSTVMRYTIMRAESPMLEYYTIVDWKEDHKMLKAEFPVDILSREATYEIQYGHASRPTHINTSWDMAMFEVCGHKWMDISQADKGVTVITDSKYGWHVRDNHVQLSLLKSPKNPDANCDMHKHYIYYAVLPHKGSFINDEAIHRAYELNILGVNNTPLLPTAAPATIPANFVVASNPAVLIEAVKVCKATETTSNTICVRAYEAHGGYADADISFANFTVKEVFESNGLEQTGDPITPTTGNKFSVRFKPFQIRSFLITFD